MATFTLTERGVTVDGRLVPCQGVLLDTTGDSPSLTIVGVGADVHVDGAVTLVAEPDPQIVRECAADVLASLTGAELAALVKSRLLTGRTDPYQATIDALVEVLRG